MAKRTLLTGLIPLKIVSAANVREHWAIKHRRDKMQKNTVLAYLNRYNGMVNLPCKIKLTRVSPRKLDDDNLQYAFKAIRDAVCSFIIPGLAPGRADDDERLQIEYVQNSDGPGINGFRVSIEYEQEDIKNATRIPKKESCDTDASINNSIHNF
jgi:hypothetical protein